MRDKIVAIEFNRNPNDPWIQVVWDDGGVDLFGPTSYIAIYDKIEEQIRFEVVHEEYSLVTA